jgi:hypothetical protein
VAPHEVEAESPPRCLIFVRQLCKWAGLWSLGGRAPPPDGASSSACWWLLGMLLGMRRGCEMAEKRRWAFRRGVPLTRFQWVVAAAAVLVGVVDMAVFIVVGKPTWAGLVGSLAAFVIVGVGLAGIGARNDRIVRGGR